MPRESSSKGKNLAPQVKNFLMVSSGKGGVGKSSVTVNLAAAIAEQGNIVGVLDADIWGFSIPRMLNMPDRLEAQRVEGSDKPRIIPNERKVGTGLLKVVSTGMLVEDEGTALMWRGLMLNRAVQHFLQDVEWGALDYLLIDMPPGTGDVQMGLAKMLPHAEMLVVTTPSRLAQTVRLPSIFTMPMAILNLLRKVPKRALARRLFQALCHSPTMPIWSASPKAAAPTSRAGCAGS